MRVRVVNEEMMMHHSYEHISLVMTLKFGVSQFNVPEKIKFTQLTSLVFTNV